MSSSFTHDLYIHGVAAAKANEKAEAKRLLQRVLNLDPDPQEEIDALYWLSEVCDNPDEKKDYLETLLAMDMSDGRARRKLAILNGQIKVDDIINPDTPRPVAGNDPQSTETKRFICPQCGGKMVFRPDGQSLICENCNSNTSLQTQTNTAFPEEQDFFVALATNKGHRIMMATRISICKGCGAHFILLPTQLTFLCPYCASSHIIQEQADKTFIAPTGIIPFHVDESAAKHALKTWFQNLRYNSVRVNRGTGIYIPIWTFDLAGAIPYHYQIMHEKKWIRVSGENYLLRGNIVIPATKNIDQIWREQINHYDLLRIVEYEDEYLANWPAETYQISVADASLTARELAFIEEKQRIEDEISGPLENLVVTSEKMRVDSYKLILLPVWIVSYWHEQRRYNVTINGQNGLVIGQTPKTGLRKWVGKILGDG